MQRILYLDGIRGLLAISVAASHIFGSIYDWRADRPFCGAYLSVDFFFILSGYVLSYTILNSCEPIHWWKFMAKRIFRLWPLHVVCLIITIAVVFNNFIAHQYTPSWWASLTAYDILVNIFFFHNLGISKAPIYNDPSWSISIEFWVSSLLLFPVMCAKHRWLSLALAVGAWVFVFVYHGPDLKVQGDFTTFVNFGVLRGIGGIIFGNFLFLQHLRSISERWDFLRSSYMGLGFISIVGWAVYAQNGAPWIDIIAVLAFSGIVLFTNDKCEIGQFLSLSPILFLGEISYSVYLCHTAIILATSPIRYAEMIGAYTPVVLLIEIIFFAYLLNIAIEKPSRYKLYRLIDD